jgi:uncharacterized protein YukE
MKRLARVGMQRTWRGESTRAWEGESKRNGLWYGESTRWRVDTSLAGSQNEGVGVQRTWHGESARAWQGESERTELGRSQNATNLAVSESQSKRIGKSRMQRTSESESK